MTTIGAEAAPLAVLNDVRAQLHGLDFSAVSIPVKP